MPDTLINAIAGYLAFGVIVGGYCLSLLRHR